MSVEPVVDEVEGARGALRVVLYPSDLLVVTVTGYFGSELLPRYLRALADVSARGSAVGFHDWERMEGYEADCRLRLMLWTIRHRAQVESVHILVKHRLVAMGVATASLLVGRNLVSTYSDRRVFDGMLRHHPRFPSLHAPQ